MKLNFNSFYKTPSGSFEAKKDFLNNTFIRFFDDFLFKLTHFINGKLTLKDNHAYIEKIAYIKLTTEHTTKNLFEITVKLDCRNTNLSPASIKLLLLTKKVNNLNKEDKQVHKEFIFFINNWSIITGGNSLAVDLIGFNIKQLNGIVSDTNAPIITLPLHFLMM